MFFVSHVIACAERETRTEMTSAHKPDKKPIETYEHKDKQRLNNPPVGPGHARDRPIGM
jgi:hypothetical protein